MDVMICCGGDPDIAVLIDRLWLNLDRIPCKGEALKIFIGDYHLLMEVEDVMTVYVEPGNPHFDKFRWGKAEYIITVTNEEIVEKYKS